VARGIVAPFIAAYAERAVPSACALHECERCGLRFFDRRLSQETMARLYDGYRGDAYFQARHALEPWYTRAHNQGLGDLGERVGALLGFLGAHLDLTTLGRTLDHGGDRGQLLSPELGRERFVYEVSGVEPVPGVRRLSSEELVAPSFDLILSCHVLEHVAVPRELVAHIAQLRARYQYWEVPLERPVFAAALSSDFQASWLEWLVRHPRALLGVDFLSTAMRTLVGVVPPLAVVKLHEHQQFFGERSLRALLESEGLHVVALAIDPPEGSGPLGKIGRVLRALTKRPPASGFAGKA
jgi:hypothetical protein